MRKTLIPLSLVAALSFGTAASAAEVTGKIKSIDDFHMTLTLTDGTSYALPSNTESSDLLSGLRPGDAVRIDWIGHAMPREAITVNPAG